VLENVRNYADKHIITVSGNRPKYQFATPQKINRRPCAHPYGIGKETTLVLWPIVARSESMVSDDHDCDMEAHRDFCGSGRHSWPDQYLFA
jgi:hypothetical protein